MKVPYQGSLIDLIFVNNVTKVLLYEQISVSRYSNHDIFLIYGVLHTMIFKILIMGKVNDKLSLIQENICLLYDRCVPVKSKLVKVNQQPWLNAEVKPLIDKKVFTYKRWKKLRKNDLTAIHKSDRSEVTKRIKIAETSFFYSKF